MSEGVEEWRAVVGWEGVYEVSDHGRVRRIKAASGTQPGKILVCPAGKRGYPVLYMFDKDRRGRGFVHALVMAAFVGPRPEGLHVNHLDSDRGNNRLSNLEYVTPKENTQHAKRAGRLRGGGPKGELAPAAKLSLEQMRSAHEKWSAGEKTQTELAAEYGVTRQAIWNIVHGRTWKSFPRKLAGTNG